MDNTTEEDLLSFACSKDQFNKLFSKEVGYSLELGYGGNIEAQLVQLQMIQLHIHLLAKFFFNQYSTKVIYDVAGGTGASTQLLLYETAANIVLVDPDKKRTEIANDNFRDEPRVTIITKKIEEITYFEPNSAFVSFLPRDDNGSAKELELSIMDVYLSQENLKYFFLMPSEQATICPTSISDLLANINNSDSEKDIEERLIGLKDEALTHGFSEKQITHPPAINNYHTILFKK